MAGWTPAWAQSRPVEADSLFRFVLDQVVVTANRRWLPNLEVPRQVAVIPARRLEEGAFATSPDILREAPGVLVQKTNLGGGSPFIRGLTGKQVVLLFDGVRLNNSTWRYGPSQYLNTVDPLVVDQVEVVYGPGSVFYGSDALGGVVHLRTRAHTGGEAPDSGLLVTQRLSSAERGLVTRLEGSVGVGRWSAEAGATVRKFGDLRAGAGKSPVGAVDMDGRQPSTGYDEGAVSATISGRLGGSVVARGSFLAVSQRDVPRSNRLIRSRTLPVPDEEGVFDPQRLTLGILALESGPVGPLEQVSLTGSVNVQEEGRAERRAGWTATRHERDDVRTLGLGVQGVMKPRGAHRIIHGVEWYADRIGSEGWRVTLDGERIDDRGRFPDGTRYESLGFYLQDEWAFFEWLQGNFGARYSRFKVDSDFGNAGTSGGAPIGRLTGTYSDLTWSAALLWRLGPSLRVHTSLAKGFRAPNVDDLAVDGNWDSGRDVPNPAVEPERMLQRELGLKFDNGRVAGVAAVFSARYRDLIARTLLGSGPDGIPGTVDDLFHFDNVARALIYGGEAGASWSAIRTPAGVGSVYGRFSYVFGEDVTGDQPLRRIPPMLGEIGTRWESVRTWSEFFVRSAGKQDRLSSGDIRDERIPEGGTPGWVTLNARAGRRLGSAVSVVLAVENLTNVRYRIHGSGIDEPGFNVVGSVRVGPGVRRSGGPKARTE